MRRYLIYCLLIIFFYRLLFCDTIFRIDHKLFNNYACAQPYTIVSVVNPIYKYKYNKKVKEYILAYSKLIKKHSVGERISDKYFLKLNVDEMSLIDVKQIDGQNKKIFFYNFTYISDNTDFIGGTIDTINSVMYFRYDNNIDSIIGHCM